MGSFYTPPVNLASPGAIGGTTPAAITGTTLTATTKVLVPDGTVAAPSISFSNDTDCGFYRTAANIIELSISNSLKLQFTTTFVAGFVPFYAQDGSAGAPVFASYNYGHGFFFTTGSVAASVALRLVSKAAASLPSAATAGAGAMIYVSDASGTPCVAFSDGTNWKRCDDAAVTVT